MSVSEVPGSPPEAAESSGRTRRAGSATWLVPGLDALVEGAWIAVADAAFAALSGGNALGPVPFALAAGVGLVWARGAQSRTVGMAGLAVLYIVAGVGAGLLGGVLSGATATDGQPIIFAQMAAVFGAIAVFRGSRHVDRVDDDLVVGSLLQWGFPLLAAPWLYAAQLAESQRDVFAATAFPATLLFAAAGLLALGLARLDSLTQVSGVNWRTNRAWLALLGGVLAVMVAIAIPAAFLLGTPVTELIAGFMGPLRVVLAPFGLALRLIIEFIFFLLNPIIEFIRSLTRTPVPGEDNPIGFGDPLIPPGTEQGEPSLLALIVVSAIAITIGVLLFALIVRLTYRPRFAADPLPGQPLEEREFRLPGLGFHRPRLGRPHRGARPTSASGAYLAYLAELESAPDLARRPDEPPATHAARVRRAGFGDLGAALLAADYELEHYAERTVSAAETARALARPGRLRDRLHKHRPRADGGQPEGE